MSLQVSRPALIQARFNYGYCAPASLFCSSSSLLLSITTPLQLEPPPLSFSNHICQCVSILDEQQQRLSPKENSRTHTGRGEDRKHLVLVLVCWLRRRRRALNLEKASNECTQ